MQFSFYDVVSSSINDNEFIVVGNAWNSENEELDGGLLAKIYMSNTNTTVVWSKVFGTNRFGEFKSVIETGDGNFVALGKNVTRDGGLIIRGELVLTKFDSDGNIIFSYDISVSNESDHHLLYLGTSVIETSNQDLIISGVARDPGIFHNKVFLCRLDSNGIRYWCQKYGQDGYSNDVMQVRELSNGDLVCVGTGYQTSHFGGHSDSEAGFLVMKMKSNGTLEFTNIIGSTYNEYCSDVIEDSNGDIVLLGAYNTVPANYEIFTVVYKLDKDGNSIFVKEFGWKFRAYGHSAFTFGLSIVENIDDNEYVIVGYKTGDQDVDGHYAGAFITTLATDGSEIKNSIYQYRLKYTAVQALGVKRISNGSDFLAYVGVTWEYNPSYHVSAFFSVISSTKLEICESRTLFPDNFKDHSLTVDLMHYGDSFGRVLCPNDSIIFTNSTLSNFKDLGDEMIPIKFCVSCNGYLRSNSTNEEMCSAHGYCGESGSCSCNFRYSTYNCSVYDPGPYCFNTRYDSSEACGGEKNGDCVGEDECVCNEGYDFKKDTCKKYVFPAGYIVLIVFGSIGFVICSCLLIILIALSPILVPVLLVVGIFLLIAGVISAGVYLLKAFGEQLQGLKLEKFLKTPTHPQPQPQNNDVEMKDTTEVERKKESSSSSSSSSSSDSDGVDKSNIEDFQADFMNVPS